MAPELFKILLDSAPRTLIGLASDNAHFDSTLILSVEITGVT
jgi:hypothetical protein